MVELLAPVGNREMLQAAIQAGADSVYFGIKGLNMRDLGSSNFTTDELKGVVNICHEKDVKVYLTVNTIIYEGEEGFVDKILSAAKSAGVDAVIAWDFMVLQKAKALGLELHLSTQASVSNFEALKSYYDMGVKRFVLARELDLGQIKKIKEKIDSEGLGAEIEVFIHGAMCVAVSGRCFMSQILNCKSANRGECIQVCRRKYVVKDAEEGHELELENGYVLSPKDLCVMPIIDKLLEADIDVFKIEGRARSPEYVKKVVESYRKAIDLWKEGRLTDKIKDGLVKNMEKVYNRGFETGFYQGKPLDAWAGVYGSKATTRKVKLGKLTNYYNKAGVAEVQLETESISEGDSFYVIGPTTGVIEGEMPEMVVDDEKVETAKKGDLITFKVSKARANDLFYKVVPTEEREDLVQNH